MKAEKNKEKISKVAVRKMDKEARDLKKKQEYLYLRCHNCPQEPKCKAVNYQEILQLAITKICEELPIAVEQVNLENITIFKDQIKATIREKKEIILQLAQLKRLNMTLRFQET